MKFVDRTVDFGEHARAYDVFDDVVMLGFVVKRFDGWWQAFTRGKKSCLWPTRKRAVEELAAMAVERNA